MVRKAKRTTGIAKKPSSTAAVGVARVGDILPQLMARYGFQRRLAAVELEKAWAETVGPTLASVTRPAAKRRGCLEILVPHSAFVQELTFREAEFVLRLTELVPAEGIKKLKFTVK